MAGLLTTPPPGGTTPDPNEPIDPNAVMGDSAPPVDPTDIEGLASSNVEYKPPTAPEAPKPRDITSKETVSGQLNDLLSQDSKYMQSAKANANEKMNARGLINSSMAVGASQKAAIDSALPIATSDANIYANSAQAAQTAGHQLQQTGYQGDINAALQSQQSAEQRKTAGQQGLIQKDVNQQNIDANLQLQRENNDFNRALQVDLKNMGLDVEWAKLDADSRKQITDSAGTLSQQWMDYQRQIYTNKDMTPEARAQALSEGFAGYKSSVNFMLAANGLKDASGSPLSWDPGTGMTGTAPPAGGNQPPTTPSTGGTPTADQIAQTSWATKTPTTMSSAETQAAADANYVFTNNQWVYNSPSLYVPGRNSTSIYDPRTGKTTTIAGTWQGR